MARRAKGWATMAITALGVMAIAGGILIAGGPGQGRAERRDDMRRSDLWALQTQLICLASEKGRLDAVVETTAACPDAPNLTDPVTGEPYRIEVIDDENLRLCAIFEVPQPDNRPRYDGQGGFDDTGCMVMNLPKSSYQPGG
ncbi:hypothetical protein FNJ84_07310 [Paracoccus sp. M683]|uniref:hypothetical protein n=1 Tax=Paracoccus sp. M683 TaxID=2594268 RepID=UPI00117C1093|nr:hypothetical protein [Paracoccus sp. M683]TRW97320.1 hypothetical protein FNJ84_07310 [Paracoccus sp. M683]